MKTSMIKVILSTLLLLSALDASAQPGRAQQSAKEMAAIDITGNWVALVTEDWRFRMVVAAAGRVGRTGRSRLSRDQQARKRRQ